MSKYHADSFKAAKTTGSELGGVTFILRVAGALIFRRDFYGVMLMRSLHLSLPGCIPMPALFIRWCVFTMLSARFLLDLGDAINRSAGGDMQSPGASWEKATDT